MRPHAVIVWFDGGCPLCRREVALMRRLDRARAIEFRDVSPRGGDVSQPGLGPAADGCPLDRGALLARFHAEEDGHLLSGAAAFAAMWRQIPLLRPFGLAARNRHVMAVLERLYLRFLRVRPRLAAWLA
ncbi:thiol-disulfide oxidoreductase DCC family protein [Lichenicoccus sp.]|uniref:thiol-disulfide oxidoreductase DCC family protein n=1 Tax=Lichenicoccus sp. TaxID=2781899 RepID=UPI003D098037